MHRSGLQIFLPFHQLPSRSLKDYYAIIKDPVSLNAVQKKVRGVIGRNAPTGHTELKSWDAFEQMTSMIWKNAREYNEDGSDLYNVSIELEVCNRASFAKCGIDTSRKCSTRDWQKPRRRSTNRPSQS
jgi:hypothetical protein